MRLTNAILTVFLFGMAASGCNLIFDQGRSSDDIRFGESFEIREGDTVIIEPGLRLGFVELLSDSRCPLDVTCVWEGLIEASFALTIGSERAPFTFEGFVGAEGENPLEIDVRSYRIFLERVDPYPRTDREEEEDIVATMRIEQREG